MEHNIPFKNKKKILTTNIRQNESSGKYNRRFRLKLINSIQERKKNGKTNSKILQNIC